MANFNCLDLIDTNKFLMENLAVNMTQLSTISYSNTSMPIYCHYIENYQNLDDIDLFEIMNLNDYIVDDFYIISDICYFKKIGAFHIKRKDFKSFVVNYIDVFDEVLFDDDVFIVIPKLNEMIVFQHGGYYMKYKIPLSPD